jgi:hypothetical protein
VVIACINSDFIQGSAICYASDTLKNDRDLVKNAIIVNYESFGSASDKLRDDKELALLAVTNNPSMLEMVSDRLKNDREIVRAAIIKCSSCAFDYGSIELRNDEELLAIADSCPNICFEHDIRD